MADEVVGSFEELGATEQPAPRPPRSPYVAMAIAIAAIVALATFLLIVVVPPFVDWLVDALPYLTPEGLLGK